MPHQLKPSIVRTTNLIVAFLCIILLTSCTATEISTHEEATLSDCSMTLVTGRSLCEISYVSLGSFPVVVPVRKEQVSEVSVVKKDKSVMLKAGGPLSVEAFRKDSDQAIEAYLTNQYILSLEGDAMKYCKVRKLDDDTVQKNRKRYVIESTRDINHSLDPHSSQYSVDNVCGEYAQRSTDFKRYFEFESGKNTYFFMSLTADGDMLISPEAIEIKE